jgi:methyltransferase
VIQAGDRRLWYAALVALVAAGRLVELARSRRNVRRLLARGGFEAGAGHYPFMVAVHAAFLPSCVVEVWHHPRPLRPALAVSMGLLLAGTSALRYWVMATLKDRWTTRVIVLPGEAPVVTGPYRFLRHPNYLAVLLELPALALVHTAWWTALVFGLLNAVVLAVRIGVENRAWASAASRRVAR